MTTPRTAAGRALLERRSAFNGGKHASVTLPSEQWNEAILAIEAEARAAALDAPDWDRIWQAFALVFSFIPDAEERAEVARHYASEKGMDE